MSSEPAWSNALAATPTDNAFMMDLAASVTNSGDTETAATWLFNFVADYLRSEGQPSSVWDAYDFAIVDIEALVDLWPGIRKAISLYPEGIGDDPGPALARFCVERLPAIWSGPSWMLHPPVTRALVIADRVDTLVGMFAVGNKPNGSKDPYALRRAAKHLLMQVVFPITRMEIAA